MKKSAAALILVLATVLAVTFIVTTPSMSQSRKISKNHEVILMRCEMKGSGFNVTNYGYSQSAPTKSTDNCAEALSVSDRNGFVIMDVQQFNSGDGYLVYTLAR